MLFKQHAQENFYPVVSFEKTSLTYMIRARRLAIPTTTVPNSKTTTNLPPTASRGNPRLILALLVLASSGSILSTDLYAPSLPHLADYFDTSAEMVKLTMSLNLLAYAFAQLVFGPLSDRVGRRPVLAWGVVAFTLCSLACVGAQSIDQLIVARVLQGFTASAEAVVGLAIIYDVFDERDRVKAMALFGISMSLTPAFGPLLGGYVHVAFGWRMNFVIVTMVGAITAILVWRLLPETHTVPKQLPRLRSIAEAYMELLKNADFMRYAFITGTALGGIFAYITAGPFILISQLGVATERFGIYHAVIVLTYVAGSLFARQLASKLTAEALLAIGLLIAVIACMLLTVIVYAGYLTPVTLTLATAAAFFGMGPMFAVAPVLALAATRGGAGAAAALIGSIEMLTASLAATSVTVFHDGTARPYALTMLIMLSLSWALSRRR